METTNRPDRPYTISGDQDNRGDWGDWGDYMETSLKKRQAAELINRYFLNVQDIRKTPVLSEKNLLNFWSCTWMWTQFWLELSLKLSEEF